MLKILFYNLFHISKQARVTKKVTDDDRYHDQLFCLLVTNILEDKGLFNLEM